MNKIRTLRQSVVLFAVIALIAPMLILAVISQTRIWNLLSDNLKEEKQRELENADAMLLMALDKYDTVLYDFCTDDDVVNLVEQINESEDVLDVNSNRLRRELSHVCNRNDGVEGITLVTERGKIFFYDRSAASFVTSTWADTVKVPDVQKGVDYQGGSSIVLGESGYTHLLQISRRIVDYQNIERRIGTVIMSINQDLLWDIIRMGETSELFICEGDQIVAAQDETLIREDISSAEHEGRRILERYNEETGWTLYNFYSVEDYNQAILGQMAMGIVYTAGIMLFIMLLLFFITNPILQQINELADGMNQMEEGNLSIQVKQTAHLPREGVQIVKGFNSMVKKLEAMVDQVKQSTVEQKNAELSAMEAQIDPHFLYNALDTINWKAIEKEEYEISGMVGALADILRYSIRNPGDTVSIGQELYWLSQYIMLQKEKLEQPLEVETDVPEEIKTYRIHKLLLQPFVENAIKHGFYRKKEPCHLTIRMRLAEDQIYIMIKDNGKGIPAEVLKGLNRGGDAGEHVGVVNVKKRLELYYGEQAAVYFESREGDGTAVHLFVKAIRGEDGGK
ncbi:sensor histidine kinase [Clostridium sp. AN503]|uniref:sensor histidine kinase n=1 Tax=Clostridium sp. AN503 TaxID=3160598 RepID=UPI00345750D5